MQHSDYPHWSRDTIRYGDTDRQGHVNNAVFSTFLETGRVQFLMNSGRPIRAPGTNFVIARLVLDFKAEMDRLEAPVDQVAPNWRRMWGLAA